MPRQQFKSELFEKQFKQLTKKDKPLGDKLEEAMAKITESPENHDSTLKGPLDGWVKKKAVKERYRFVYKYCELCFERKKERCAECQEGAPSVVFREVFHRDEGYD